MWTLEFRALMRAVAWWLVAAEITAAYESPCHRIPLDPMA
jgi:hypothetical protein